MIKLLIKKGGRLFLKKYSRSKGKDIVTRIEVTDTAPSFLFDNDCDIAKNITLKDIFLLVDKHKKFFSTIFRNCYVKEIVDNGLRKKHRRKKDSEIDKAVLYYCYEIDERNGRFDDSQFPSFSGEGIVRKDSKYGKKKGETERYAIEFCEPCAIMHLPLELKREKVITYWNCDDEGKTNIVDKTYNVDYGGARYSLFDILYGIFWELSFNGTPENSQKMLAGLVESINKIEEAKDE